MALSIFNSATGDLWYRTAGVSEEEFESNLVQLTSLSLIKFDSSLNRYFLSSIVKEYCKEKLTHSNISDNIYPQWVGYYISFSKNNGGTLRRRYYLIEQDWENLWQAVEYTVNCWRNGTPYQNASDNWQDHAHNLITFASLLKNFCRVRGRMDKEILLCEEAAKASDTLKLA